MATGAASDSDDITATDRRRGRQRRRVLLTGKVLLADGLALDCAIRNLSEQGAQIRIAAAQPLPNQFHLIETNAAVAHRAQVVWREDSLVGLVFWERIELDDARAILISRLRQAWLDSRP